uniref:LON peptidase N-terminal domain and RING finger protein 1-like n=1 Tax=Podarcis muralis TaxID=64176 RepID=A0A670IH54_PODMU
MDIFLCAFCQRALWDPVTVSCGHTFCRRCLGGDLPSKCRLCGGKSVLLGSRTVACNVLLCDLLEKCLDKGTQVARLKTDLQELLRSRDYRAALRSVQKGVALAPDDLTLRLCRSEVYVALQQYPDALEDLEVLCRQKPEESEILTNDASPLPGTVMELKSDASQNLKGSNSGKELTALVSFEGEPLQDLMGRKEVWLGEDASDHSQAALSIPEWLRKKSNSGFSAEKERDFEEGASAAEAKSTQEHKPDFADLLSTSDLECSLCIRMFFEPVTTPCGHTFCKECLERCLDHRPNCPLCKQSLREYLRAGKYNTTLLLEELMMAVFPLQLADRKRIHQAEMAELSNLTKNIPIFVCTMSFPGIVCPLHVFEPRYRLMMRRCQETGTKMFGMCMYENGKSFADYGCMLEIQKIAFLPDGRSLVDTIGKRRFQVLRRGHRDGYHTADIEYLDDEKVEGEELAELQILHDCTYQLTQRFYEHGDTTFRQLLMHHGPLPEKEEDIQASPDGPVWCWWLISILPLDLTRKLTIFSETSLKARLTQLKHILNVILESRDYNS